MIVCVALKSVRCAYCFCVLCVEVNCVYVCVYDSCMRACNVLHDVCMMLVWFVDHAGMLFVLLFDDDCVVLGWLLCCLSV